MNPPIFLVGFMGSGKTRVGKLLARCLKWNWVDLDHKISSDAGLSIPEIFSQEGEEGFRKRERASFLTYAQIENTVVSCGGGIVTVPENLEDLVNQPRTICLRISPETVFRRVGNDPRRPLLQGPDPFVKIQELMQERKPYYSRFDKVIDVDKLKSGEIVNQILDLLDLTSNPS